MIDVISLGLGQQSVTMALMAAHKEITPMPECAIFADTRQEKRGTYDYLEYLEPLLPFPIIKVSAGDLGEHELSATMRDGGAPILVCYRTKKPDGSMGLIRKQCTDHYKRAPINREISRIRERGAVTVWIGISRDEAHRMKPAREKYKTHRWPLIEKNMTRGHCLEWLRDHNYKIPPTSACKFCPLQGPKEWREMPPPDFDDACIHDEAMRHRGGDMELYVWREPIPLREVDFSSAEDMGQIAMFGNECEGMCGV